MNDRSRNGTSGRRRLLTAGISLPLAGTLAACATPTGSKPIARVVVIGGGYGGATTARYLRKWDPRIEVVLVERNPQFVSCPISNLVLAGLKTIDDITLPYSGLERHGVRIVRDEASAIDFERRQIRLAHGPALDYDRLVLSPGVDFQYDRIPGLQAAEAAGQSLHAWKAGAQTVALRQRLEALPDGGVVAISIPKAPYRCPPGPYERASLIAGWLQRARPRSKLVILDANPDIVSKKALFMKAWSDLYKGIIEYRPDSEVIGFDGATRTAKTDLDDVRADLFNVIPPQQAGRIAQPLADVNGRWVSVDFRSFESSKVPGVHVIGDACASAPGMPKSGFMANNHGKVLADALIASLTGEPVNPAPILTNTCYSFVSGSEAMHVSSVHQWNAEQRTVVPVAGAGGVSPARSALEAQYALAWARNIWADMLA